MHTERAVRCCLAVALLLAGCVELGVVGDGTTISVGKPSDGRIVDGVRLPDQGEGFTTRDPWKTRGQRYGTDELVDLLTGVSRRVVAKHPGVRLVVADLSGKGGGEARLWHRSHQSGRDVDLLYYVRDAEGNPVEADVMRVLDGKGVARDGSGITFDVARNWQLIKELLTAKEAYVQYIFVYRPLAEQLIEHATRIGEPEALVARAAKAVKQPGDSAPHNDHMHVRIYCPPTDRMYGCVDIGPLELLAEREAEAQQTVAAIAGALPPPTVDEGEGVPLGKTAADVWNEAAAKSSGATDATPVSTTASASETLGALLRASAHRIDLRGWR